MSCYFKEEPCLFDTWPYPRIKSDLIWFEKGFSCLRINLCCRYRKGIYLVAGLLSLRVKCCALLSDKVCPLLSAHLSSLWKEMWLCLNRCKQRDDIVVLGALGFSGLQNWISTSPFHALSSTITSSFYLAPHVSPSYRIPPSVRLLPVTPYRRRMRRRAAASAALKEHKRLLSAIFLPFLCLMHNLEPLNMACWVI